MNIFLQLPTWLALGLITAALLLAGCGQKGKLYRPEPQEETSASP